MVDKYYGGPEIEPTTEMAREIQRLTLQDLRAGEFPHPLELANPDNTDFVERQRQRLEAHPKNYLGSYEDGELVAYAKAAEWHIGDELPFVDGVAQKALKRRAKWLHTQKLPQRAYGIFGLVADEALDPGRRQFHIEMLTQQVLGVAAFFDIKQIREAFYNRTLIKTPTNIVMHDHDFALPILTQNFGFKPVGPRGEADGAPGLQQQRYQHVREAGSHRLHYQADMNL